MVIERRQLLDPRQLLEHLGGDGNVGGDGNAVGDGTWGVSDQSSEFRRRPLIRVSGSEILNTRLSFESCLRNTFSVGSKPSPYLLDWFSLRVGSTRGNAPMRIARKVSCRDIGLRLVL